MASSHVHEMSKQIILYFNFLHFLWQLYGTDKSHKVVQNTLQHYVLYLRLYCKIYRHGGTSKRMKYKFSVTDLSYDHL